MSRPDLSHFNARSRWVKVFIDGEVISKLNRVLLTVQQPEGGWAAHVPKGLDRVSERVEYLSMVIAIDYRHWGFSNPSLFPGEVVGKRDFYADIDGVGRCRGSQAMVEMLKVAAEKGIPWYTPGWLLQEDSRGILKDILTGVDCDSQPMLIPDFSGRFQLLCEISRALLRDNTSFYRIFFNSQGSVADALGMLRNLHVRYKDEGHFDGAVVPLMKLAQLTIIAVSSVDQTLFPGDEMKNITICPDYQVPKALLSVGALVYDSQLAQKVIDQVLLDRDGAEEVEIRLGSVLAAEELKRQLLVSTEVLDFALWKLGRESSAPHHLCETNMY